MTSWGWITMKKNNKEEEKKIPDVKELKELWDLAKSKYTKEHTRMRLLDATDNSEMWKALGAKFPHYQILPDTNFISYVKANIVASIYTVAKSAELIPTSNDDMELVQHINIALDKIWELNLIGYTQFLTGDRAALLNLGLTQVGWDKTKDDGAGNKGTVITKSIDPMKFMRDPFATSLETAHWCATYDMYHKYVFESDSRYKEKYKEYRASKEQAKAAETIPEYEHESSKHRGGQKDYDTLIIYWVKKKSEVHEIHVINNEEILYSKENIQPSLFPFAELYCNNPAGRVIGTSECRKIFANNVAYNLMDSIALTAEYKNQRPPKFISSGSGLNVKNFSKHGDEADRTFVVNGEASKAVHYHQFPQTSQVLPNLKQSLAVDMKLISGVDERYTGRDTGSIITTGGTEEMLNRVTIIDTPKIVNYENYTKQLTKLILLNFNEYAQKRRYFYKMPSTNKWDYIEIDFPNLDKKTLMNYNISISSELPKNKQRIAAMATMIMENQMQYKQANEQVDLITPEEWLMFQDLPMKEFMLERMGIQRLEDYQEKVAQILFEYGELTRQGVPPDDALALTAQSMKEQAAGGVPMEGGPMPMMQADMGGGMPPGGGGMPPGGEPGMPPEHF